MNELHWLTETESEIVYNSKSARKRAYPRVGRLSATWIVGSLGAIAGGRFRDRVGKSQASD